MNDLDEFLQHYREELLGRLQGFEARTARLPGDNMDSRQFVDHVIETWSKLPKKARSAPLRPGERTFWYALYTMEDLTDFPAAANTLDPFEGILLRELGQARRLLEARAELPQGKFASRPDGR